MPYNLHQDSNPPFYCEAVYTGSSSHGNHHSVLSLSTGPALSGGLNHPRNTSPMHYGHSDDVDMQPLDLSVKPVRCEPPKKRLRLESCEHNGDRFEGFVRTDSISSNVNRVSRPSPYPHISSKSPNHQMITSIPTRSPQGRSESPYYAQRHTPSPAHYGGGSVASGSYSFHPSHPSAALPSSEGSSYQLVPDLYDPSKSPNYFRQYHDPQSLNRQDYHVRLKEESDLCDEEKPGERDNYNNPRSLYSKNGDGGYTRSSVYRQQLSPKPGMVERVESKETELSKLLASNQTSDRVKSEASLGLGKKYNDNVVSPVESVVGDSRKHHHPEALLANESSFKSSYQPEGDSKTKEVYRPDSTLPNCRVSPSFTHMTTLNLIQKANPVPSGYPSPPASYSSGLTASATRQSPTNASHIVEQSSPSDKENSARHKSRKSLLLARTAGFFQAPADSIAVDKIRRNDENLIHLPNSEDRTDDSTKISLLDFWISKILMERSEEGPKKPCSVDYIRHTVDGQRKIRISLVDLIEMQVEQSLKA